MWILNVMPIINANAEWKALFILPNNPRDFKISINV